MKKNKEQDPRYYFIQVKELNICNKELPQKKDKQMAKWMVKFQLGNKKSETCFKMKKQNQSLVIDQADPQTLVTVNQAHIFSYEAQDFLNIQLLQDKEEEEPTQQDKTPKPVQNKDKKQNKAAGSQQLIQNKQKIEIPNEETLKETENTFYGLSRVLLPPLIKYPCIRHTVRAKLIKMQARTGEVILTQSVPTTMATITLQIYFKLDFKAQVDIIPLTGHLNQSNNNFIDIQTCLELKIGDQTWESLPSKGIRPIWSGHFHAYKSHIKIAKKDVKKNQSIYQDMIPQMIIVSNIRYQKQEEKKENPAENSQNETKPKSEQQKMKSEIQVIPNEGQKQKPGKENQKSIIDNIQRNTHNINKRLEYDQQNTIKAANQSKARTTANEDQRQSKINKGQYDEVIITQAKEKIKQIIKEQKKEKTEEQTEEIIKEKIKEKMFWKLPQNPQKKNKDRYFDIARFDLNSANNCLKVSIKQKQKVLGSVSCFMANQGFFKYPRKLKIDFSTQNAQDNIFVPRRIDLFTRKSEFEKKQFAGFIHVLVRFIFDIDHVKKQKFEYNYPPNYQKQENKQNKK